MYNTKPPRALTLLLFLLISGYGLFAQGLESQKTAFMESIKGTTVEGEDGSESDLLTALPFLNDSEFFATTDGMLILPFQAEVMQTIPDVVNTGGDNFEDLLQSKVGDQSVVEFLLNQAAASFDMPVEKIRLRFLWYLKDRKTDETKLDPHTVVVGKSINNLEAHISKITTANIELVEGAGILGGPKKFFKKYSWDKKVASL